MKKLFFVLVLMLISLMGFAQHLYLKNVTVKDSLFIEKLATNETKVLSPTSTGGTTVLETVFGTAITWLSLTADEITVTNDINVGDTIEFDNGAKFYNTHTDTAYIKETVIKFDGDVLITGQMLNTYSGGLSYISTAGTQTIGTGGTFEKLFEGTMAYTGANLNYFTESNGRLTYMGTPTQHFIVNCNISVESGEVAQVTQFRIAKNGTTIAGTNMIQGFVSQSRSAVIGLNWIVELATNDYIEIFGTSDTSADVFDVKNLTLIIAKY